MATRSNELARLKPGLNLVLAWTFARRLGCTLEGRVVDGRFRVALVRCPDDHV